MAETPGKTARVSPTPAVVSAVDIPAVADAAADRRRFYNMYRINVSPRPFWSDIIRNEGIVFNWDEGEARTEANSYWNERATYVYSEQDIAAISQQCEELYGMCLEAGQAIMSGRMGDTYLPSMAMDLARESFDRGDVDIYSRFDVAYDPEARQIKLLEYNSDTPTSLLESTVCQDTWLHDRPYKPIGDLGAALVDRWTFALQQTPDTRRLLHLIHVDMDIDPTGEDRANVYVMAHAARLAGWDVKIIELSDVIYDATKGASGEHPWWDADGVAITHAFKLYPWEDMVTDSESGYDRAVCSTGGSVTWYEPAWKMGSSTKLLLPALWSQFMHHPSLLPAYLSKHESLRNWVRKPLFGREGDGVVINAPDYGVFADNTTDFFDAQSPCVWQEYAPLRAYEGQDREVNIPVLGVWMIGDKFAGLSTREASHPITSHDARFVPSVRE
ncbi:glutathionylspermidine synthase family protein [Corynebacterium heidelbergense]|uniref:Glutathionylspermidine synthase family protein n=2 Tax=Corynebacterium heidelbergense TaxID=2055947 RepID=A0A364V3H7_9CORY|nr:glutathionylspermidine synthase family protein [Corynebacterium heidelbergense]